jgi:hypothetical protein
MIMKDAGTRSIVGADRNCQTLIDILKGPSSNLQFASAVVLYRVARHCEFNCAKVESCPLIVLSGTGIHALRHSPLLEVLGRLVVQSRVDRVQAVALGLLSRLCEDHGEVPRRLRSLLS